MRRLLLCAAGLALATPALAQERTLLADGFESGGFGGPVVKFSEVANEFAVFAGGRGGWIINHTLVIGAGGYGLANDISLDGLPFTGRDVEFGYGGLEVEYISRSDALYHFTLYLLVGGGGLTTNVTDGEAVFVLEPAANLELNVTTYFRLNVGASYRLVAGVDAPDIDAGDLSAPNGVLTFKFGAF